MLSLEEAKDEIVKIRHNPVAEGKSMGDQLRDIFRQTAEPMSQRLAFALSSKSGYINQTILAEAFLLVYADLIKVSEELIDCKKRSCHE